MTALANDKFVTVGNLWPRITKTLGRRSKSGENVEFGNNCGGLANPFCLFGDTAADFLKKRLFDVENLLFGGKDLLFVLFQFRRHKAFGSHERLLAVVVIGNQVKVGFGNFDVVAKDLIETNL